MIVAGRNTFYQLLTKPDQQSPDGTLMVSNPSFSEIDMNEIIDFSIGNQHSVFINKEGKALCVGDDRTFFIGTESRQIYQTPTQVKFKSENNINIDLFQYDKFISAKCGQAYTIYLTEKGVIIICSLYSENQVPAVHTFDIKPIYIACGYLSPVAIDAQGDFYIFSRNPSIPPRYVHLREPVYDICRCSVYSTIGDDGPKVTQFNFTAVVTVNGKLFANGFLNNGSKDFSEVYSMIGVHVSHIYGYCGHCIAISDDGHAFVVGYNKYGQLGIGSTNDLYDFQCLDIKDTFVNASVGGAHSLLVSESGKLYGFGSNHRYQLFNPNSNKNFLFPFECNLNHNVKQVFCGNCSSLAIIGNNFIKHLGYDHFFKGKELLAAQIRKISYINIQNMENQIKKLKEEIELEKKKNLPQQDIIQENIKFKKRMDMKLSDIFDENDRLAQENEEKSQEIKSLNEIIENLKRENDKLKKENMCLKDIKAQYSKVSSLNEELTSKNKILNDEIEEKNAQIATLHDTIEKTKENVNNNNIYYKLNPPPKPQDATFKSPSRFRNKPNITKPILGQKK